MTATPDLEPLPLGATRPLPQPGNARTLIPLLAQRLHSTAEVIEDRGDPVRFQLDIPGIYLDGVGERTRCLAACGDDDQTLASIRKFWMTHGSATTGVVFVFCTSAGAHAHACRIVPPGCGLVLAPHEVTGLLHHPDARPLLKRRLRERFSRRRLSLYNIGLPATDNRFFGRKRELAQLLENPITHFAIPGPARVGKSSLLQAYKASLVRLRDPRATRTHEIDFYALPDTRPDTVARHIAMTIKPSYRSSQVHAADLVQFFRFCSVQESTQEKREKPEPLELLLDETDEVCGGEAFRYLGQAARHGLVRLILAGKKCLYDYATRSDSVLGGRVRVLRLESLDEPEARDLIRRPLEDLGLSLCENVIHRILAQSGRRPHLIQYYCQRLVELTVERSLDEITPALLAELERPSPPWTPLDEDDLDRGIE
ncbi:MAG TPA: hypothetical protein VKD72_04265 [Gemmataceae bacterium]|nr:hypothetical protein [Gemmataceae bacterium]